MCGILGVFYKDAPSNFKHNLKEALDILEHRGPDDSGSWFCEGEFGQLGLGHRRLSIIDLSKAGHQPMFSLDQRFSIIFNGEIYNYRELRVELINYGHRFITDSDTEVLLAAWIQWGKESLKRLVGMFSFVIFDRLTNQLFCIRDAFGIKPFYYQIKHNHFAFSSEPQAISILTGSERYVNLQRAYEYLVYGEYDQDDSTFYRDISQLRPGHLGSIDLADKRIQMTIEKWWSPSIGMRADLDFQSASEILRGKFLESVKLHLRSDVPLGVTLSGGLDSSAVACAMRHLDKNLKIQTFSYIARGSNVDEEAWVDIVNQKIGAESHKVIVSHDELAEDLEEMIRAQGEPFGSTSIYAQYRVFKQAKEQGVKVTLDGQGADEMLAGYNGYPAARVRSLIDSGDIYESVRFIKNWTQWPGRTKKQAILAVGSALVPNSLRSLALRAVGFNPKPLWLHDELVKHDEVSLGRVIHSQDEGAYKRRLSEELRAALCGRGLAALMRHGDRNSMKWSVESRVPFLTTDLAEFLLELPEDYLISSRGETKSIFRHAMRGIMPDEILDRKDKIGFQTPEKQWMMKLKPNILDWVGDAKVEGVINKKAAIDEIMKTINGEIKFSFQTWRIINFCCWVNVFNIKI